MRIGAILIGACCLVANVQAADISVTGDWSVFVNEADLTVGAGSDLRTPIDSSTTQAAIDITNTGGGSWSVKVRKSDMTWPAGVNLAVRLTHPGSGPGTVSGGGSYITLNSMDQVFFSGTADRLGMQIQLRLADQSVSNSPPDNYSTSVTYTIE